jgi:hypothetical protein
MMAKEIITVNSTFDDDVSIDGFQIMNDNYYRREIASLNIVISGCRFEALLSIGGSLLFPDGVRISDEMKQRATEIARQAAMSALVSKWFGRARSSGTLHLIRPVDDDACEEATSG